MGILLALKDVIATGQLTVAQLTQLQNYSPGSLTYNLTDSRSKLLAATDGQLQGAGTVTVNTDDTLSIANIIALAAKDSGTDPTYTTITDSAANLGGSATNAARMNGKIIVISDNATATQYRRAITNAGDGGSVSGAVVDTDSTNLASGTAALTGATSITLKVQSSDKDFTSTTFLANVDFDLNGQNGVLLKNNIKEYWWKSMTQLNENIVGIDLLTFSE